jgi:hypothetical protein
MEREWVVEGLELVVQLLCRCLYIGRSIVQAVEVSANCAGEGVSYVWAEGIDANDFAMDTANNEFDKAHCVRS